MKAKKILDSDIDELKIARLPTRPTASVGMGGLGYTSSEMKAAFDRLPLYLVTRYNELIESIEIEGDGSVAESIKTGIDADHTLETLFRDIENGNLATYLICNESTLAREIFEIKSRLSEIEAVLNINKTV